MKPFIEDKQALNISSDLMRVSSIAKKTSPVARLYVMVWVELMYQIWLNRYKVYFHQVTSLHILAKEALFRVAFRVNEQEQEF